MWPLQPSERAILILTGIDGALRDVGQAFGPAVRRSMAELATRNVPVVLTSYHSRAEIALMADELGIVEPFIAENGKVLGVPKGYFARLPELSTVSGRWAVIEFAPPAIEDAIEMLMWLYRVSGDSPLLVGIGVSWSDHLLLRHVDVPVVVKNPALDQRELRAHFPQAYVTAAAGPAGWDEAVLGVRRGDLDPDAVKEQPHS